MTISQNGKIELIISDPEMRNKLIQFCNENIKNKEIDSDIRHILSMIRTQAIIKY